MYDAATPGPTSALRFTQVGLKGTSFADGRILQVTKQSNAAWSTAVFADFSNVAANNTLNTLNVRSNAAPDAGRTFRFEPISPIANDIAVQAIYTLGKIATPSALPQTVRVYLANVGTAAQASVAVTLSITGANTISETKNVALPVGAKGTVTFTALPATMALGTNTVTVSVVGDDNNTNNSMTVSRRHARPPELHRRRQAGQCRLPELQQLGSRGRIQHQIHRDQPGGAGRCPDYVWHDHQPHHLVSGSGVRCHRRQRHPRQPALRLAAAGPPLHRRRCDRGPARAAVLRHVLRGREGAGHYRHGPGHAN
ncbi:hypothetical protein ACFQT0_08050 [Hymenobacter humi]|uniref:CARDB domain-containing protein n=1 Tax=Hymenobacter humi TaxID=1411620 RepID=A0ABW2U3D0_9BACT